MLDTRVFFAFPDILNIYPSLLATKMAYTLNSAVALLTSSFRSLGLIIYE